MLYFEIPQKDQTASQTNAHQILLLDKSGSMSGRIASLIEDVKKVIQNMQVGDMLSIVLFAGTHDFKTLLRGATIQEDNSKLYNLLDQYKVAGGTTCFSTPLGESVSILKDLIAMQERFAISLFTDGEPVISEWSAEQESEKVSQHLTSLNEMDMALMTIIGYGDYYNVALMQQIADQALRGKMVHASSITEYSSYMQEHIAETLSASMISLDISELWDHQVPEKVYILSAGNMRVATIDLAEPMIKGLAEGDILIKLDQGEDSKIAHLIQAIETFHSNRLESKKHLIAVGDQYLYDSHMNAFTNQQVVMHIEKMREALRGEIKGEGSLQSDLVIRESNYDVYDLLEDLYNHSPNVKYMPYSELVPRYNLTSLNHHIASDTAGSFHQDNKTEVAVEIEDLSFNRNRFNASIDYRLLGKVLTDADAMATGLPQWLEGVVAFKKRTVVLDGRLNMPSMAIKIESKSEAAKLIQRWKAAHPEFMTDMGNKIYKLDLTKIPVLKSSDIAVDDLEILSEFADRVIARDLAMAKQKVLKELYKEEAAEIKSRGVESQYTPEQIRKFPRLNVDYYVKTGSLAYKPATPNKEVDATDSYLVRYLDVYSAGYSSLPKVEEAITKPGKSAVKLYMHQCWDEVKDIKDPKVIKGLLREVKLAINQHNKVISQIASQLVLNGGWFANLKEEKGKYYYETEAGTKVMLNCSMRSYLI